MCVFHMHVGRTQGMSESHRDGLETQLISHLQQRAVTRQRTGTFSVWDANHRMANKWGL